MDAKQKDEIKVRAEILEILAKAYNHSEILPKIKKLKRITGYYSALEIIHELEKAMRSRKHEQFRKKLRQKFKKKVIKRKKR